MKKWTYIIYQKYALCWESGLNVNFSLKELSILGATYCGGPVGDSAPLVQTCLHPQNSQNDPLKQTIFKDFAPTTSLTKFICTHSLEYPMWPLICSLKAAKNARIMSFHHSATTMSFYKIKVSNASKVPTLKC